MSEKSVTHRGGMQRRAKVKTGCATCRIRRIKCDESKPSCRKCVSTGRHCDGYESPFRLFVRPPAIKNPRHATAIPSGTTQTTKRDSDASNEISLEDVERLSRYFSTKTMFDVKLGCDEEARQVLHTSLRDPAVRHAVSSLKTLREDLETSKAVPLSAAEQTPSHSYGLQQYCMALGGLASTLSAPRTSDLKSAILCCQIFISIEQVRGQYDVLAQHIIQGLKIMRENRARPYLDEAHRLVPARNDELPRLDVFIIKLFAAPCKFAEPPTTTGESVTSPTKCPLCPPPEVQLSGTHEPRPIAPDMKTRLVRIATSTLAFLEKVSHVISEDDARRLRSEKSSLLDSLESWLADLEKLQAKLMTCGIETIAESFLRMFRQIMRVILFGALEDSQALDNRLQTEYERLRDAAAYVTERVKGYKFSPAVSSK